MNAERAVRDHERLIGAIASRFTPRGGLTRDDLIQEGRIGVWNACSAFRPEVGLTFSAFAGVCIERQMVTALTAATRQKHKYLNQSFSLDLPAPGMESDDPMSDSVPTRDLGPLDSVLAWEEIARLGRGMRTLTANQREAVMVRMDRRPYALHGGTKHISNALTRADIKLREAV